MKIEKLEEFRAELIKKSMYTLDQGMYDVYNYFIDQIDDEIEYVRNNQDEKSSQKNSSNSPDYSD